VAIPQRAKMDWIIEKSQELGISEMIPIETERTIVRMSGDARKRVLARWEKIIREAAKQSWNTTLLKIFSPLPLSKAVQFIPDGEPVLFFHPEPKATRFSDWIRDGILNSRPNEIKSVHVFFGPEGGFSEGDWTIVQQKNAQMIYLGDPILKVETAVVAVAGAIKFCA
jgi:16S rRNA (uracil1498-N3)-methyltransferase